MGVQGPFAEVLVPNRVRDRTADRVMAERSYHVQWRHTMPVPYHTVSCSLCMTLLQQHVFLQNIKQNMAISLEHHEISTFQLTR